MTTFSENNRKKQILYPHGFGKETGINCDICGSQLIYYNDDIVFSPMHPPKRLVCCSDEDCSFVDGYLFL